MVCDGIITISNLFLETYLLRELTFLHSLYIATDLVHFLSEFGDGHIPLQRETAGKPADDSNP